MQDSPVTNRSLPSEGNGRPIGLLAAWGRYPILVADALRRQGYRVYCLGVRRHADRELIEHCDHFMWFNPGNLSSAFRYFQRHGVQHATMAGKFHKVEIYRPWAWFRYLPDYTFLKTFYPYLISHRGDRRDDTLLGVVVRAFADHGVTFLPATDFAPELLVGEGSLAGPPLSAAQQTDIEFGWRMAKEMGRLDIGQSVCVKDRAVLAVEAIEGTDVCIQRAGQLCRKGGFTVIKVAKPQQDMRFDVPTVGVRTLQTIAQAKGRVLAIEAERTILLDDEEFHATAGRLGISVVAMKDRPLSAAA